VYGERSYLDKNQRIIGKYDISFLFKYFDILWKDLLNLKRRLIGQVSDRDATCIMIDALPDFYSYFMNIARFAIAECVDKSPFAEIEKNENFVINVGDYMANTGTVFTEKKTKDAAQLAEWFDGQLGADYVFGDYSNLDFSRRTFMDTDFRYAQFRHSNLEESSLAGSSLIGANFRNAKMAGACLDYCLIHEADFTNASLKNANIAYAHAKAGLQNDSEWKFVGFLPAVFRNADLANANFAGANLVGADFYGATLTNANFTAAALDKAIFNKDAILPLTDEQKSRVITIS
jgi:uncharacterized protein YjbI with pentapeptide repeats